jgi:hypothetical protein
MFGYFLQDAVDLCLYFFNHLIRRGLPCTHLRTDEDGALIRNIEFCKLLYKQLGMAIESTGGYESSLNGGAESPTKTIKKMTRASLVGGDMPDHNCCFALQYTACTNNQILNRMTRKVPSKVPLADQSLSSPFIHSVHDAKFFIIFQPSGLLAHKLLATYVILSSPITTLMQSIL